MNQVVWKTKSLKILLMALLFQSSISWASPWTNYFSCTKAPESRGSVESVFLYQRAPNEWVAQIGKVNVWSWSGKLTWSGVLSFEAQLSSKFVNGYELEVVHFWNSIAVLNAERPFDFAFGKPLGGIWATMHDQGEENILICNFDPNFDYDLRWNKDAKEALQELLK